ncbi:S-layer homology domain-containing protein [Leptolyngbya sp. FACHB-711]|uniref:S-layer homology domain-containing protein n=1 Tax=Leptolyngbya sp. FACHB-711 TaxID=2692813 RepID=UPI0016861B5A|nr:S-layer homology domain-containing protein [Leptolyngbya sp. FACHB-711]MBD2024353.1 S-layer homology domain-containing protein [Leptolyngbya sp. FACHB-711]
MKRGGVNANAMRVIFRRQFLVLSFSFASLVLGYRKVERLIGGSGIASDRTSSLFSDIQNHWAEASIQAIAKRGILNGYPDQTFRPDSFLTRAEFAVILSLIFLDAEPVREPMQSSSLNGALNGAINGAIAFSDVPAAYWAYSGIEQASLNGWFSGYHNGTFLPNQPISRTQVMAVLGTALGFESPAHPLQILKLYFKDADRIPDWTRWPTAAAILQDIVVSYPDVRQFYPDQNATRGEVAAILCRVLKLNHAVPLAYSTCGLGINDLKGNVTVAFPQWRGSARLMQDIQTVLANFQFYPADRINGEYNFETEQGLTTFCDFYSLNTMKTGVLDEKLGWTLTHADPIDYFLASAQDRNAVYKEFLAQEVAYPGNRLAFLDRGAASSRYFADISQFPARLAAKLDEEVITPSAERLRIASLGDSNVLTGTNQRVFFTPFPEYGTLPAIDSTGLDFLHPDIQEACLCVGSLVNGTMQTHWSGRNALDNVEMWSTTKIIPLLNVVCQANAVQPDANVRDCLVRPVGSPEGYGFYNLAVDPMSYQRAIASSNAAAATFKQFFTPPELENWVRNLTGNRYLDFTGRYDEPPFIQNPDLWSQTTKAVLLKSAYSDHLGTNAISTCDLARFAAMLGWHNYLPTAASLPAVQWSSLETVVRAMAMDNARYLDGAIERLHLSSSIQAPVIVSKVGFGRSQIRDRTELCYVGLVWFIDTKHLPLGDHRPVQAGKPAVLRTFSLALRAAKALNNAAEEARQLDARVAAEVTEILRRIMTQELA